MTVQVTVLSSVSMNLPESPVQPQTTASLVQPAKYRPGFGVAVSVTVEPARNCSRFSG